MARRCLTAAYERKTFARSRARVRAAADRLWAGFWGGWGGGLWGGLGEAWRGRVGGRAARRRRLSWRAARNGSWASARQNVTDNHLHNLGVELSVTNAVHGMQT
jgi:hypothetical protein